MESPRSTVYGGRMSLAGGLNEYGNNGPKKNIFEMDPKCMSCSGNLAGGLLQCFKMACLAYYPTNIVFRSKILSDNDFLRH
jgi:hypothetical protein